MNSGPIDPKNLTDEQTALIAAIAQYSTQYADNGQVVLGKWVDYGGGFVNTARDTGSVHYNPHPDMWNIFSELGEKRDEVSWLVNQQVVQTGISKGLPFEYSYGIPVEKIETEQQAIEAIFSGATNSEVIDILKTDYLPVRIKEIQELQKAGYEFTFDEITNSFFLFDHRKEVFMNTIDEKNVNPIEEMNRVAHNLLDIDLWRFKKVIVRLNLVTSVF